MTPVAFQQALRRALRSLEHLDRGSSREKRAPKLWMSTAQILVARKHLPASNGRVDDHGKNLRRMPRRQVVRATRRPRVVDESPSSNPPVDTLPRRSKLSYRKERGARVATHGPCLVRVQEQTLTTRVPAPMEKVARERSAEWRLLLRMTDQSYILTSISVFLVRYGRR